MTPQPAPSRRPGAFFVLGLHNTATSTLVAMLNSHPRILVCYETWGQPPMLTRYGLDLCREEPALREIFDGRLDMAAAYERAGRMLAERGHSYDWVGDKRVVFTAAELEALGGCPAVYVWRPVEEWLLKREVRRAYATDFDAKVPALHFLRCLNVAVSQERWLCLSMSEIFQDPTAFFAKVSGLLGVECSKFDHEWWQRAASPTDRIKASMRWIDAHPSSLLPPQRAADVRYERAEHPFWKFVDGVMERLRRPAHQGGRMRLKHEIERELHQAAEQFPRLPLAELYRSHEEWRHGAPRPKPQNIGLISRLRAMAAALFKK